MYMHEKYLVFFAPTSVDESSLEQSEISKILKEVAKELWSTQILEDTKETGGLGKNMGKEKWSGPIEALWKENGNMTK